MLLINNMHTVSVRSILSLRCMLIVLCGHFVNTRCVWFFAAALPVIRNSQQNPSSTSSSSTLYWSTGMTFASLPTLFFRQRYLTPSAFLQRDTHQIGQRNVHIGTTKLVIDLLVSASCCLTLTLNSSQLANCSPQLESISLLGAWNAKQKGNHPAPDFPKPIQCDFGKLCVYKQKGFSFST